MRRLIFLASTIIFFDVAFFAAIAPLLPDYADEFGLSEAEAGVLAAAYAAGTLLASLPAGWVATRVGPQRTVIVGLVGLGVSSLVFGFAQSIWLLDAARFVQGVAGAFIWSGALAWLIISSPDEERGSVIGTALGTAVAGALLGPILGAIAAEVGTEAVFGAVLVVALLLAGFAARLPAPRQAEQQPLREVAATILSRPILLATGFVAVPSLLFGTVEVLVPLRIDDLGGSHLVIAGGFVTGAAIEAILAPLSGRYSDRIGRRTPFVIGTAVCAAAMVGMAAAQALGPVLAALVLVSFGAGICFAPAMTLLSETADESGLHQGFAAGLSNTAWASGQTVGGIAGGAAASAVGFAPPTLAVAALLLVTSAYAFRVLALPPVRTAG